MIWTVYCTVTVIQNVFLSSQAFNDLSVFEKFLCDISFAPFTRMSNEFMDVPIKVGNKPIGTVSLIFLSSSVVNERPVSTQKTVLKDRTKRQLFINFTGSGQIVSL